MKLEELLTESDQKNFKGSLFSKILLLSPEYKFLEHFRYFYRNRDKWDGADEIIDRLFISDVEDVENAWRHKTTFRAAQAEISCLYLIENYLSGRVKAIEHSLPGNKKSCDFLVLRNEKEILIEVKAQSGQQHGTLHPLRTPNEFTPQGEDDLHSWLFETKISSKTGKEMVPYCVQASLKGADVLFVMTDIFPFEMGCATRLGEYLMSGTGKEEVVFSDENGVFKTLTVNANEAEAHKFAGVKELWLYDTGKLSEMVILKSGI